MSEHRWHSGDHANYLHGIRGTLDVVIEHVAKPSKSGFTRWTVWDVESQQHLTVLAYNLLPRQEADDGNG